MHPVTILFEHVNSSYLMKSFIAFIHEVKYVETRKNFNLV